MRGMYRIQAAVISGDETELVRVLEDEKCTGRDWEWRGKEGRTVLELATLLGRSSMVQSLISAGAPPNPSSAAGYGALHMACVWGQLCCVRELVTAGANHRQATKHNETPQQLASRYGNYSCAKFLSSIEACQILHQAIQAAKDTLANTDLIAGKWNKDDKLKVSSLCAEKLEWLVQHESCCSEEEATQQTTDFHLRMHPHLDKLQS